MAEVDIDGTTYFAYASLEDADGYLAANLAADTWRGTDDDRKGMALVTATRVLDRQRWRGTKTDTAQVGAWPRSGTGLAGVEDGTVPADIVNGSIELASALLDGSEAQTAQSTAQTIQSLRAGSVSLSYFRGAEGAPLRFPLPVMELIRLYLAGGGSGMAGAIAYGTGKQSTTVDDYGYTRGL